MNCSALLQRRTKRAMQTVLEVVLAAPVHDVGEKIAVERGIVGEQLLEIESLLRCDQLIEPHLLRIDRRPLLWPIPVLGIGSPLADSTEDHQIILLRVRGVRALRVWRRAGTLRCANLEA